MKNEQEIYFDMNHVKCGRYSQYIYWYLNMLKSYIIYFIIDLKLIIVQIVMKS